MKVLFAPHSDDEALFAAFTLMRERPRVIVCSPSVGDYGDTCGRFKETHAACAILGCQATLWAGMAVEPLMRDLDLCCAPTTVWAPHSRASHPDHRAVAEMATRVFGDRVRRYHTYEAGPVKVRAGAPVPYSPAEADLKRRALACYVSQRQHPRAKVFFGWDLDEFVEA